MLQNTLTRNTFRLEPELGTGTEGRRAEQSMVVCACYPSTAGVGAGLQVQGSPGYRGRKRREREEREKRRGRKGGGREREKERRNKGEGTKEKDLEDRTLAFLVAFLLPHVIFCMSQVNILFFLCVEKALVPFQVSQAKRQSSVSV